jgi:two-component system nitrate/nitrite response regulator NarL
VPRDLRKSKPKSKAKAKPGVKAGSRAIARPAPRQPPITLVLIDDNRLLREGLASLIHDKAGFTVLVASADVNEALAVVRSARPAVVLVDFSLEEHDSLALTATIHAESPPAKVVIMGLLPTQEDVAAFVRAGASGFIMKDATFDEFFRTLRAVAAGEEILPPALTTTLFAQIARNAGSEKKARLLDSVRLTARERETIDLLSEGLSNKEIADRMHIAIHTVKSHVHNVLEKLALRSRLEVAAFSHNKGAPRP